MKTLKQRFMEKVLITEGCWLWQASSADDDGYGGFSIDGRTVRAHRVSYEIHYKVKLSEDQHVLHICDVPGCVRPSHLFLGDHATNVKDKVSKDRQAKGEKNGNVVLTEEDVLAIRREFANNSNVYAIRSNLSKKYNVTIANISHILSGRTWRHVK